MRPLTTLVPALASVAVLVAATPANACIFSIGITDQQAARLATTGYLVRARVIRGYDRERRQPELLQIEKVFVGEKLPPTIELWHDDRFYEPASEIVMCDFTIAFSDPESDSLLLALFPARDPKGPLRLSTDPQYFGLTYGLRKQSKRILRKVFGPLVRDARRTGRLRSVPTL